MTTTPFLNLHAFVQVERSTQLTVLRHFCGYEVAVDQLPPAPPPPTLPALIADAMRVTEWAQAHDIPQGCAAL